MEQSVRRKEKVYRSPIRLILVITATIFLTHIAVMVLFTVHPHFSTWVRSVVQSALLLVLLSPVLYFFSFRPLILHMVEREQAEEAMRQCEQKYRNLFEHLCEAAFLVDGKTGRILDTNSQGERLLGRTRGEIMGMNQSKLFPSEQEEQQRMRFEACAREQHPADYTVEVVRKDHRRVPVRISDVPTTFHDRPLIIEFVRELTE